MEEMNVQKFVDDLIEKSNAKERMEELDDNRLNSYGAAQLYDGTIVKIRNNFFYLEQVWQMYMINKSFNNKEEMDDVYAHTNGGLFDSGDVILRLEDIRVLYRSQLYVNSSDETKEEIIWKTALINKHLDETVYGMDDGDDLIDD